MVLVGLLLFCLHFVLTRQNEIREYCHEQDFTANCGPDEIVVMGVANYGRMRTGRCITAEIGHIGCHANALSTFDKQCSGKSSCRVKVLNQNINIDVPNCNSQLLRYLEASYTCSPVFQIQHHFCNIQVSNSDAASGSTTEPVSNLHGTIVSSNVLRSGCGGDFKPLVIEALPGQQFHVIMIDFHWSNTTSQDCNIKYGQVLDLESGQSRPLCGGKRRRTAIMVSTGHRIQLKFDSYSSSKFVLQYEVRNCPTTLNMVNGWFQSDGMTGEAGCHDTAQVWHLTCSGNTWIGLDGDCLAKKGHLATVAGIDITHDILIMAASAIVLLTSGIVLIVGCCYIRSYCKRGPPAPPPEVYYSRDFRFMRPCDNCDTTQRDNLKSVDEQQETSFSHPSDARYRSLHPNGMQGRPLPEIPEYDVPANVRRDEQETLLIRGKPNDANLPNDVIVPSDISLPSDRGFTSAEEETRRMQSMVRGHPNNMTLFSPNSRMPKNPRLYASTMGRVLRDHPNMVRQPKYVQPPNIDFVNMPPQQTQLPKESPKMAPQPDVIRVERIHTKDNNGESPVPVFNEDAPISSVSQGQTQGQILSQTNGPVDGAQNNQQGNMFRSLVHHGPRFVERPLSV